MGTQRKAKHVFVINSRGKRPRKAPPRFGGTTGKKLGGAPAAKKSEKQ